VAIVVEPRNERAAAIACMDARVDDFRPDDIVTVRQRGERWRVLDKHDPRGSEASLLTICCVPLVLCEPVTSGDLVDVKPLWIEPRDLRHVCVLGGTREAA
jgi:hypothetical protein